jgi:virginiamycin B lyase
MFAVGALFAPVPDAAASHSLPFLAQPKVTITEFDDLPRGYGFPECVTAGPDSAFWVTEDLDQDIGEPSIAKIGADGKRLAEYYYGENASPSGNDIVAGPDGAVWFSDNDYSGLIRLSPQGEFTRYPTPGRNPLGLALGPDGAFWFAATTRHGADAIGRLTTSGQVSSYERGLSSGSAPIDIASGTDGAMWFTEYTGSRIGRIAVDTHAISEFSKGITSGSDPYSIAPGPDCAMWFTERRGHRIGRITTRGVVTEFARLPSGATPNDIVAGPDGALWFTEDHPAMIGRITTRGAIAEYSGVSAGSEPTCIAAGPGGDLWFTELTGNRMDRVSLHS